MVLRLFLFAFSIVTSLTLYANSGISIGKTMVVVLNENTREITVHTKEKLEIIHRLVLPKSGSIKSIALSSDESKIWYVVGEKAICVSTINWKEVISISGVNSYNFRLDKQNKHLIHFSGDEKMSAVDIYDLNTAKITARVKVKFSDFLESIIYNESTGMLTMLGTKKDDKSEVPMKGDADILFPETKEDVNKMMHHDGKTSQFTIYDVRNNVVIVNKRTFYSPNFSTSLEMIGEELFAVTQIGTCKISEGHEFTMTSLIATNVSDFAIADTMIAGATGFTFFTYTLKDDKFTEFYDDEVNELCLQADASAFDKGDYYMCYENTLYRFKDEDGFGVQFVNVDIDISLSST